MHLYTFSIRKANSRKQFVGILSEKGDNSPFYRSNSFRFTFTKLLFHTGQIKTLRQQLLKNAVAGTANELIFTNLKKTIKLGAR